MCQVKQMIEGRFFPEDTQSGHPQNPMVMSEHGYPHGDYSTGDSSNTHCRTDLQSPVMAHGKAVQQAQHYIQSGKRWVVDMDLEFLIGQPRMETGLNQR